jgi:hypothetical protein
MHDQLQDDYTTPWPQDRARGSTRWAAPGAEHLCGADGSDRAPDQRGRRRRHQRSGAAHRGRQQRGSPWLEGNAPGARPARESGTRRRRAHRAPSRDRAAPARRARSISTRSPTVSRPTGTMSHGTRRGSSSSTAGPTTPPGTTWGSRRCEGTGPAAAAGGGHREPLDPNNQPSAVGVGAPGNATNAINGFYQKWMGRAPESADVVQQYINSGKSLSEIENLIANSAEAKDTRPRIRARCAGALADDETARRSSTWKCRSGSRTWCRATRRR